MIDFGLNKNPVNHVVEPEREFMISEIFEPPRWPSGPKICIHANLPAFESDVEAREFNETHAPGNRITKLWRCLVCRQWHYTAHIRSPSGDSSGTAKR